jgi:hypothetical protein
MSDESKKASGSQPQDKVEDLNQKPITEQDAQSVKGGMGNLKVAKKDV